MTYRTDIKDAVATALDASEWGYDFELVRSWSQAMDAETMPVFGVSVRRERVTEFDKDEYARECELIVAWKRNGNEDIEDTIDTDAAEIEAIVLPILRPLVFNVIPQETIIESMASDGGQRSGAGMITFACTVLTDIMAD